MAEPSQAELLELGRKAFERKQIEAKRTKAHAKAVSQLIAKHQPQFDELYKATLKDAGVL